MKNDVFTKGILSGILICLLIIAFKPSDSPIVEQPAPNVEVNNHNGRIVQIAPNKVGVVDPGYKSGWEQLVVFEYNPETKEFEVVNSLPYEDYFNHPKLNDIPVREDKYGN